MAAPIARGEGHWPDAPELVRVAGAEGLSAVLVMHSGMLHEEFRCLGDTVYNSNAIKM